MSRGVTIDCQVMNYPKQDVIQEQVEIEVVVHMVMLDRLSRTQCNR